MSQENVGIAVSAKPYFPDHLVSKYSNNIFVQYGEHEIIVLFFEVRPPLLSMSSTELKTMLKNQAPLETKAECVARIILAPDTVPEFIEKLKSAHENFLSKRNKTGGNQ